MSNDKEVTVLYLESFAGFNTDGAVFNYQKDGSTFQAWIDWHNVINLYKTWDRVSDVSQLFNRGQVKMITPATVVAQMCLAYAQCLGTL